MSLVCKVFAVGLCTLTAGAKAQGELQVPGFGAAVVVEPRSAGARPVLVVLHGMGDAPESICPAFDLLARGRAWIVCTRGITYGRAWTYPRDRAAVRREVDAAIAALAAARATRVDRNDPVLAGFSLGAMYASFLARDAPRALSRALVIDTHHVWTRAHLRRYLASGGRAACFVCTRTYVDDCARLDPASVVVLPTREHGYDRYLFDAVRERFEALVASDTRWRG